MDFSGVDDAEVFEGGVYFLPGVYTVEIRECKGVTSRKRQDLYIVECKILKSSNPLREAGTRASWCVNMSNDSWKSNLKKFAIAVNGGEEDLGSVKDFLMASISAANPVKGEQLELVCTQITTRAGMPFTKHEWSPLS